MNDIRLTRNEADITVRQFTGRYSDEHGTDFPSDRFDDFARKLAWQIGVDCTADFRDYLADAITAHQELDNVYFGARPHDWRDTYEEDLNVAVNRALESVEYGAGWINRADPIAAPLAVAA